MESLLVTAEDQNENDAEDLRIAATDLGRYSIGSTEFNTAIDLVMNSYEGDHELFAYTHRRKGADDGDWTPADQLYMASTKVLNLATRLKGGNG
ncbi:MAG: hypothetical protein R3B45_00825 [Bdellovibrionota bacterium]